MRKKRSASIGCQSADDDAAARRTQQARDHVHQRGLAGTVRAYQAGDTRRDGEIDTVHAEDFAVEFTDVVEDDSYDVASSGHLADSQLAIRPEQHAANGEQSDPGRHTENDTRRRPRRCRVEHVHGRQLDQCCRSR